MRSAARPSSRAGAQSPKAPTRKVFNCIVDDTALIAGVKKSTRNGIRQWVQNGQIRLFVPLHALEQLDRLKAGSNRLSEDVRDVLQWLDDATSAFPNAVTLQGGFETFETWAEVERFALPKTLFSEMDNQIEDADDLPVQTEQRLTLGETDKRVSNSSTASDASRSLSPNSMRSMRSSASPISPPTSPAKADKTVAPPIKSVVTLDGAAEAFKPAATISGPSSGVPVKMRPLMNYILWRIHQELDPIAALESFIFLCNDENKAKVGQGFGVRTKRLEELRNAVGREDREFKNRLFLQKKEHLQGTQNGVQAPAVTAPAVQPAAGITAITTDGQIDDGEESDEVVFKPPPKAPAAMLPAPSATNGNVMDPDAFGRTPASQRLHAAQQTTTPPSPRQNHVQPHQSPRGNHALPFAPRGSFRGNIRGSPRGRGAFAPRGRGGFASGNGPREATGVLPNGQIDPNSFSRPNTGRGGFARGGRRLWVPT